MRNEYCTTLNNIKIFVNLIIQKKFFSLTSSDTVWVHTQDDYTTLPTCSTTIETIKPEYLRQCNNRLDIPDLNFNNKNETIYYETFSLYQTIITTYLFTAKGKGVNARGLGHVSIKIMLQFKPTTDNRKCL